MACGATDIFYRGSSRYGTVLLCYTHAEALCPSIEIRNTPWNVDHVNETYRRSREKETAYAKAHAVPYTGKD